MFKRRLISTSIDKNNTKQILFFENKFNLIFVLSVAPIFLWLYYVYTATILSKTYFFSNIGKAFEKYEIKGSYFEPFGPVSIILGLIYLIFVLLLINTLKNRQRKIEVTNEDIKVYKEYDRLRIGLVFFLISALPWLLPYIWYGLFIKSIQGFNYEVDSASIFTGLILLLFYFVIKIIFHLTRNFYIKETEKTYSRRQIDGYIIKKPLTPYQYMGFAYYNSTGSNRVERTANKAGSATATGIAALFTSIMYALLYGLSYRSYRIKAELGGKEKVLISGLSKRRAKKLLVEINT